MILVKENTPTPDVLGAANGISEVLQMAGVSIASPFIRSVTELVPTLFYLGMH